MIISGGGANTDQEYSALNLSATSFSGDTIRRSGRTRRSSLATAATVAQDAINRHIVKGINAADDEEEVLQEGEEGVQDVMMDMTYVEGPSSTNMMMFSPPPATTIKHHRKANHTNNNSNNMPPPAPMSSTKRQKLMFDEPPLHNNHNTAATTAVHQVISIEYYKIL